MPTFSRVALGATTVALATLLSAAAGSHPSTKPDDSGHHDHAHPPGALDAPSEQPDSAPSDAEKKQRIGAIMKRHEERQARREEIAKDRRQALRRRLMAKLEGRPLDAAMKNELRTHARRMADLGRIRYVAASADDYDSVQAVDRLIGRENSRHEAWWRLIRRSAVAAQRKGPAGSGSSEAARP